MEKNFDKFFESFNDNRDEGSKKFNVKATNKVKRIDEIFDTEKLKSEHEISYLQGDFGPEGELGKALVSNITKTAEPIDLFHSNLVLSFPYVATLEFKGYTPLYINPTRILYELVISHSDGTHMIRGKASLDFTINNINGDQEYSYYYNNFVQGQDVNGANQYDMMKDSYPQGVVTNFDDLINSLNENVKPKIQAWGQEVSKWIGNDPINSDEAKKGRVAPTMN